MSCRNKIMAGSNKWEEFFTGVERGLPAGKERRFMIWSRFLFIILGLSFSYSAVIHLFKTDVEWFCFSVYFIGAIVTLLLWKMGNEIVSKSDFKLRIKTELLRVFGFGLIYLGVFTDWGKYISN